MKKPVHIDWIGLFDYLVGEDSTKVDFSVFPGISLDLTAREELVLAFLMLGKSFPDIAATPSVQKFWKKPLDEYRINYAAERIYKKCASMLWRTDPQILFNRQQRVLNTILLYLYVKRIVKRITIEDWIAEKPEFQSLETWLREYDRDIYFAAHLVRDAWPDLLSPRELEIAAYGICGYRQAEIANILGITLKMVELHRRHIRIKTNVAASRFLPETLKNILRSILEK